MKQLLMSAVPLPQPTHICMLAHSPLHIQYMPYSKIFIFFLSLQHTTYTRPSGLGEYSMLLSEQTTAITVGERERARDGGKDGNGEKSRAMQF